MAQSTPGRMSNGSSSRAVCSAVDSAAQTVNTTTANRMTENSFLVEFRSIPNNAVSSTISSLASNTDSYTLGTANILPGSMANNTPHSALSASFGVATGAGTEVGLEMFCQAAMLMCNALLNTSPGQQAPRAEDTLQALLLLQIGSNTNQNAAIRTNVMQRMSELTAAFNASEEMCKHSWCQTCRQAYKT